MASIATGKDRAALLIRQYAEELKSTELSILDVGACDGVWSDLIRREVVPFVARPVLIDAVEAYKPNAARILDKYENVYVGQFQTYNYAFRQYDLIIFGDVLEHMTVADAQDALREAYEKDIDDVIVAVPYRYKQGAIYGNPYEVHVQDDLTPEIMAERYPLLELLFEAQANYAYYHFKGGAIGGRR